MERQFQNGEVIFSEGEKGLNAYVVRTGGVVLTKGQKGKQIVLAELGEGELFGEMGPLDGSPRSATATSSGVTILQEIPRAQFLKKVTNDPNMAMTVMRKLVARLRVADELLAQNQISVAQGGAGEAEPEPSIPEPKKENPGLFARLFGLGGKSHNQDEAQADNHGGPSAHAPAKQAGPLKILVAIMAEDDGNLLRRQLIEGWVDIPHLQVFELRKTVQSLADDPSLLALSAAAHKLLAQEEADCLVWGGLDSTGRVLEVHMERPNQAQEERPGLMIPDLPLCLPLEEVEAGKLRIPPLYLSLGTVSMAASIDPKDGEQSRSLMTALDAGLETVIPGLEARPAGYSGMEQASLLAACGHGLAQSGNLRGQGSEDYGEASSFYRKAIRMAAHTDERVYAMLNRSLGFALQAFAERADDPDMMERAAEAYKEAAGFLTQERDPYIWAKLQHRIGVALYKVDLRAPSATTLKESLASFQNALKILTKEDAPWMWAEIMTNTAQTLQLYGEHMNAVEVIEKAIESCHAALEVRTRDAAPWLWAATQNCLGSACFLLARHRGAKDNLEAAIAAFRGALEVYESQGVSKPAAVTERNLAHAEEMLAKVVSKGVAHTAWGDEES